MNPRSRLSVGVVGPSHPNVGGIVEHTREMTDQLARTHGLAVFAPWERYRPQSLPRGAAMEVPESRLGGRLIRGPRWDRPQSWARSGRDIAEVAEQLLMVLSSPAQLPALAAMRRSFRSGRPGGRAALVVHNVLPHDAGPISRRLAREVMRARFRLLVHSGEQADLAQRLGADAHDIVVAPLPYHGPTFRRSKHPDGVDAREARESTGLRLLFLGFVRPYKGLDVLLDALQRASLSHTLVVMGEFWQSPARFERQIVALGLEGRVDLRPGFAAEPEVQAALGSADVVVLPYLNATASQLPRIAFAAGLPVVATDVGDFGRQIRDGIDGLIVQPADPHELATALDAVVRDGRLDAMRREVRPPDADAEWRTYLDAIGVLLA